MSLKTVFLIFILILIKFSIGIKGNDENKNKPTKNTATIVTNIISLDQLILETLQRFRYVIAYWEDLLPFEKNNVKGYHGFLKYNADRISPPPLTAEQILANENILRLPLELLNNYLKTLVTNHQQAEQINREISRLAMVARQLVEYEKHVLQRWHEIPDAMKIGIKNIQQQTIDFISRIGGRTRSGPFTYREIIQNRNIYIDPMLTLGVHYDKVLKYLENRGQLANQGPQNQGQIRQVGQGQLGSDRLGQLRLEGQQQLGSGGQKRPIQEPEGPVIIKKPKRPY